jgi:hypothetical protein
LQEGAISVEGEPAIPAQVLPRDHKAGPARGRSHKRRERASDNKGRADEEIETVPRAGLV